MPKQRAAECQLRGRKRNRLAGLIASRQPSQGRASGDNTNRCPHRASRNNSLRSSSMQARRWAALREVIETRQARPAEEIEGNVLMVEATRCPNCSARLGDDGTCHKCWWRPARAELRGTTLAILLPSIAIALAACFTYLALQEGTPRRWTAAVSIWLAVAVSVIVAVRRSQPYAGQ
jgi:hypothetical protein